MNINFKQCNKANYGGVRGQTEYIVIHYTSNRGDTAENNATYFNREALKNPASAHYFVDENEIWSSVPEGDIAYHCGAKAYKHPECRNSNSIGIEICMNDKNGAVRYGSVEMAVQLTRELMEKYQIPAENVIRHYDVTGKNCPEPMVENERLWAEFLENLESGEEMKVYKYVQEMPDWAQDTFTRLIQSGYIAKDDKGEVSVQECSLQPMVYLDRLTGGKIEKLPEIIKMLEEMNKIQEK